MEGMLWRVRVAVLWLAMAVCMSATVISVIVTPGNTLMQGEMEGGRSRPSCSCSRRSSGSSRWRWPS